MSTILIKKIAVGCILSMVIAYAGFSTIIKTELFLGTVTSITNEQLSTIFRREVVVDGISGNYLSDIRLNSIDIASFDQIENGRLMHIEGMELQLSILQILLHRGDVLAGIKRIDIDSVDIQVLRTQNDRWNILDFLIPPPVPEGEPIPPPPNLKAEIHIKHLFGEFVDYKGWGKTLPEQPYIFDLSSAEVKLDFKDREKVPISISGLFDGGALQMAGHLNIFNGQYQFDFSLSEQNPSRWGHYVLPTAGYELRGAQLNMVGEMQSKSPFPKQGIPFNFNTTITATNSELKTPFFEEPIRQIAGTAQFNNTERLQFQILSMRGQLHEQPFHGLGHFYLADSMVSLSFKSPKFEISTVDKLFPSLREWKLNGTGDGQAVLAGHLQAPAFTGYFETETLSTAIGSIEDARVSFKRQESKLDLVANDGRFHQGTVSGKMHIQFQAPAPSTVQSSIRVQDINVSDFLPKRLSNHPYIKGDLSLELSGSDGRYNGSAELTGTPLEIRNQIIGSAKTSMEVDKTDPNRPASIHFRDIEIQGMDGDSVMTGTGTLRDLTQLAFNVSGTQLSFLDPWDLAGSRTMTVPEKAGKMDLKLDFYGELDGTRMQSESVISSIQSTVHHGRILGHKLNGGTVSAQYRNQCFNDTNLRLYGPGQRYAMQGEICGDDFNLDIQSQGLKTEKILAMLPPNNWPDWSGTLDTNIHIERVANRSPKISKQLLVDGKLTINDAKINDLPINTAQLSLQHDPLGSTRIHSLNIYAPDTHLVASGDLRPTMNVHIQDHSQLNLRLLSEFSTRYGILGGVGQIYGRVFGSISDPTVDLWIDIDDFQYDNIQTSKLRGYINYDEQTLSVDPLFIKKASNEITLDAQFGPIPLGSTPPDYELNLKVNEGNLSEIAQLGEEIYARWLEWKNKDDEEVPKTFNSTESFSRLAESQAPYYYNDYISIYDHLYTDSLQQLDLLTANYAQDNGDSQWISRRLSGSITGSLGIKSRRNNPPRLSSELAINEGTWGRFQSQKVLLDILSLEDDSQSIKLDLDFDPERYAGVKSITLSGNLSSNGILETERSEIDVLGTKYSDFLHTHVSIPELYSTPSEWTENMVDLKLDGAAANLLSFLSPGIQGIQNNGSIRLYAKGPMNQLSFNGTAIQLKDASLELDPDLGLFSTPIHFDSFQASIQENKVAIDPLRIKWITGRKNAPKTNSLVLRGDLNIPALNLTERESWVINSNLRIPKKAVTIDWEKWYQGQILIDALKLSGDFGPWMTEPSETSPLLLSGSLTVSEGRAALPSIRKKKRQVPLGLDLDLHIGKAVFVEGGAFGSGLFTVANNILLDLRETPDETPIHIGGNSQLMTVDGNIYIDEGHISFFDQLYTLIPPSLQYAYYRDDPTLVSDNEVHFETSIPSGQSDARLLPVFKLHAISYYENYQSTDNIQVALPHDAVILRMNGRLDTLNTSLTLESYKIDNAYSKQPNTEFVQSWQPFNQDESQWGSSFARNQSVSGSQFQSDSDNELRVLGETQANIWFKTTVRPIERKLAQILGLYNVQVDYNLGAHLTQQFLPGSLSQEEQLLGVHFLWNPIPEKLFFRVKTDTDLSSDQRLSLQGIQLTEEELSYYLSNEFSFTVSNIQDYGDRPAFDPKASVKYHYEF